MVAALDINTPAKKKYKKSEIPPSLVYETLNGKNIYYKNYQAVLNGEKTLEEVMASSSLQSIIIGIIYDYFLLNFRDLKGMTNEVGLHISYKNNLGLDLAIYEKEMLKNYQFDVNYMKIAPKVVVEVDIKGELSHVEFLDHILEKSRTILNFGTEKVVWILSKQKIAIVAKKGESWRIYDWEQSFEFIEGHPINLNELFKEYNL